ncbi:N-acetylmuramoyl-L-alanine amidase family protein [Clostridium neonatale]|uniref:N-acetylmuramoyl-L-alanine amidase family protein n=1 Tax=Clostridium neonatale TaxID=137838 RepID=UPI003D35733B
MKSKKVKNIALCMLVTLSIGLIGTSPASAAWKKDNVGWWNTEGSSYSIGWRFINNDWYHFAPSGYMSTGWINDNGTWYYLDKVSGDMKTGWLSDNGTWYYLNNSGTMQTGFITLNNNTYYLNESGAMAVGDITINGVKYTFAQAGEQITSSAANTTTSTDNSSSTSVSSNDSTSSESSGSSGGSGGGGGSSSGSSSKSSLSTNSSYSDLYGMWKVDSHIESNMKSELEDDMINLAIGEKFVVSKNQITSIPLTISNPIIDEEILTSSEFSDKFDDTFANLGIPGNKVKCITVTRSDNKNHSVDLIITEKGKVLVIVKGTVFKLVQD